MPGFKKKEFDRAHGEWDVTVEALFFVGLVERRVLTVDEAGKGLAMNEKQYENLKKWDPHRAGRFEELRKKRAAALEEFKRMLGEPEYLRAMRAKQGALLKRADEARRKAVATSGVGQE